MAPGKNIEKKKGLQKKDKLRLKSVENVRPLTFSVITVSCFKFIYNVCIHMLGGRDKRYLPLRFFSTTTTPLPSAAG